MEHIVLIKKLMDELSNSCFMKESGYSTDKETIKQIFKLTQEEKVSKDKIHARLTVIDSMYSTQMNKRYYALNDLADKLVELQGTSQIPLSERFKKFATEPDDAGILEIFNKNYGIGKDGNEKGKAVSLLSKYAYYETDFQFPIYDSIVRERYAGFWIYCGWDKKEIPKININRIDTFIKAINTLLDKLNYTDKVQRYDSLDRILWVVGKIIRGNLSLILSEDEYVELALKLNPKQKRIQKDEIFSFPRDKQLLLSVVKTDILKQLIELAHRLYEVEREMNK